MRLKVDEIWRVVVFLLVALGSFNIGYSFGRVDRKQKVEIVLVNGVDPETGGLTLLRGDEPTRVCATLYTANPYPVCICNAGPEPL